MYSDANFNPRRSEKIWPLLKQLANQIGKSKITVNVDSNKIANAIMRDFRVPNPLYFQQDVRGDLEKILSLSGKTNIQVSPENEPYVRMSSMG